MTRSGKRARRLVVDGEVFLWLLGHTHHALGDGRYRDCCDVLEFRLFKASGGSESPAVQARTGSWRTA